MRKYIKLVGTIEVQRFVPVEYDGTEENLQEAAELAIFEHEAGVPASDYVHWQVNTDATDYWLQVNGWQDKQS